ncbi:MAG: shikimate dehydrogenase [Burkholderiaceae bacterium]|uniref:shikimate dehydrogenase family protein n=1 Tax=Hydrogenophaga sp. TaxID=1904254 RepID=UPI0027566E0A|nr:shikimate dehydrogenase [Hydrogenophaga sp.]MDP2065114.1 shikimate dehydrogenase [Burkholderiaceae bacterium]MDZ4145923.1 shikimate dehydrogenase [Burkholderiales bacterium]MDZ4400106.1 shikimate dehydrogenase [Hydrogenophaga sp.]
MNAPVHCITGTTDTYLILGDPVEQVRAPESFNAVFARFGIDAVLVPVRIGAADLAPFVRAAFMAPNIKGMWVTIPHKVAVTEVLDHCSEIARVAGAVNAIRRNADGSLEGGLFDGEGLVASLDHFGMAYAGRRVLIVGAGGAASAIGASLVCRGAQSVAELALFDPAPGRAPALAARLAPATQAVVRAAESNDPAGFDLVINASPLGLKAGDPLPVDVARMAPGAALVDILMKNQPTPVMRAARAQGLVAQPGFEMMILQAHLYLEFMGFRAAAAAVQRDAAFIRAQIDPSAMQGEICHTAAQTIPTL